MNVVLRLLTTFTALIVFPTGAIAEQIESKLAGAWVLVDGYQEIAGQREPLTNAGDIYLVVRPDGGFYQAGQLTHSALDELRNKGDRLVGSGSTLTVTRSAYEADRSELVLAHSGGYQLDVEATLLYSGMVSFRSSMPSYGGADLIVTATLGRLEGVELWKKPDALLAEWKVKGGTPFAVDLSADGRFVVAADLTGQSVYLWDATEGRQLRVFEGHAGEVCAAAISPDGRYVASGSRDASSNQVLKVWDAVTGKQSQHIDAFSSVRRLQFLADGKSLLAAGTPSANPGKSSAGIWNVQTGEQEANFINVGDVRGIAASLDERAFLCVRSTRSSGAVGVFEALSGDEVRSLGMPRQAIDAIAVSPNGRRAMVSMQEPFIREWSVETGDEIRRIHVDESWASQIAYLPDGQHMIVATESDNAISLWDIALGNRISTLGAHRDHVYDLKISRDGQTAVSCSGDGTIKVWRIPS